MDVSIICNTYNQVNYIEKTLESLVNQKTNASFEIIVHDDFSSDGTKDIILSYYEKYPSLVVPIIESENQYSKGKNITRDILLPHIRGKYLALCEGDDYWIDENKIQNQWEILEAHPECDMCACRTIIVSEDGEKKIGEVRPYQKDCILSQEEVIGGGGRYVATPSLFYRKTLYDRKTDFESILSFDYTLQIKGSLRGGIYYIDKPMSAYRDMSKGSWSVNVARNKERIKEHNKREIKMLEALDTETKGLYHEVISKRIREGYVPFLEQLEHNFDISKTEKSNQKKAYLWGLGMRGEAFEEFCSVKDIKLEGVCDKKNEGIGEYTKFGNVILDCEEVLKKAETIFASTSVIYESLNKRQFEGEIVNLQKYMPWG